MPLTTHANGASPISPSSRLQSKTALAGDGSPKAPVLKSSTRLSEEALLRQTDQIDSFLDPDPATDAAILAHLETVSEGQSAEQLTAATRAMRRYVVLQGFKKADPSDGDVKTFARLWSKAEALTRNASASSRSVIKLEFGPVFSKMINVINCTEVSVIPRK